MDAWQQAASGPFSGPRWQDDSRFDPNPRNWDTKNWGKLDLDKPSSFQPWWGRARSWIVDGIPAVDRLLRILEEWTESPVNSPEAEQVLGAQADLPSSWDVSTVSWKLSNAIRLTSENSVVDISQRLGDRYEFELYRYLYGRFKGAGPEQGQRVLEESSRRAGATPHSSSATP